MSRRHERQVGPEMEYYGAESAWRPGRNRLQTVLNTEQKRAACRRLLNRWRPRSRWRTGWCEFTTRLFWRQPPEMGDRRQHHSFRRRVACQLIGHDCGSNSAPARTIQLGGSRVGAFFALSPSVARNTFAISSIDIALPFSATAMKRSPAAAGYVIARMCRSATSRTSTTAKWIRGQPG